MQNKQYGMKRMPRLQNVHLPRQCILGSCDSADKHWSDDLVINVVLASHPWGSQGRVVGPMVIGRPLSDSI